MKIKNLNKILILVAIILLLIFSILIYKRNIENFYLLDKKTVNDLRACRHFDCKDKQLFQDGKCVDKCEDKFREIGKLSFGEDICKSPICVECTKHDKILDKSGDCVDRPPQIKCGANAYYNGEACVCGKQNPGAAIYHPDTKSCTCNPPFNNDCSCSGELSDFGQICTPNPTTAQ